MLTRNRFNSDRGVQYRAIRYTQRLAEAGAVASLTPTAMAEAGTLVGKDDAVVMNVTSALAFVPYQSTPTYSATKAALHSFSESLRIQPRFTTRAQARTAVAGFIDEYNNDRRHSTAGRLPPAVYETQVRRQQAA